MSYLKKIEVISGRTSYRQPSKQEMDLLTKLLDECGTFRTMSSIAMLLKTTEIESLREARIANPSAINEATKMLRSIGDKLQTLEDDASRAEQRKIK